MFRGSRGRQGIGGFGLQERSTEGTKVRGGTERPVCVVDGKVWFALALQKLTGWPVHAAMSHLKRFNQTRTDENTSTVECQLMHISLF